MRTGSFARRASPWPTSKRRCRACTRGWRPRRRSAVSCARTKPVQRNRWFARPGQPPRPPPNFRARGCAASTGSRDRGRTGPAPDNDPRLSEARARQSCRISGLSNRSDHVTKGNAYPAHRAAPFAHVHAQSLASRQIVEFPRSFSPGEAASDLNGGCHCTARAGQRPGPAVHGAVAKHVTQVRDLAEQSALLYSCTPVLLTSQHCLYSCTQAWQY